MHKKWLRNTEVSLNYLKRHDHAKYERAEKRLKTALKRAHITKRG